MGQALFQGVSPFLGDNLYPDFFFFLFLILTF